MKSALRNPLVTSLAVVSAAAVTATVMAVTGGQSASAVGTAQTTTLEFEQYGSWGCGQTVKTFYTGNYRQVRVVGNWLANESDGSSAASLKFYVVGRETDEMQIGELALANGSGKSTVIDVPGTSLVIKAACNGEQAYIGVQAYGN